MKSIFIVLLSLFYFSFYPSLIGQNKFDVTAGAGLPELVHVGVKYNVNQTKIGLKLGTLSPKSSSNTFGATGECEFHVAGKSKLTEIKPWYSKLGMSYIKFTSLEKIQKSSYFNIKFGRDFNFSEKMGVQFDLGLFVRFYQKEIELRPSDGLNIDFPVLPSVNFGLFYRL